MVFSLTDFGKELNSISERFAEEIVEDRNKYFSELEEISKKYDMDIEKVKGAAAAILNPYFAEGIGLTDEMAKRHKSQEEYIIGVIKGKSEREELLRKLFS